METRWPSLFVHVQQRMYRRQRGDRSRTPRAARWSSPALLSASWVSKPLRLFWRGPAGETPGEVTRQCFFFSLVTLTCFNPEFEEVCPKTMGKAEEKADEVDRPAADRERRWRCGSFRTRSRQTYGECCFHKYNESVFQRPPRRELS